MRHLIGIWLINLIIQTVVAHPAQVSTDSIALYFKETREATQQHIDLWNKDLYGPLLLVDPETRRMYANEPDEGGLLRFRDGIYQGMLPRNVPISNTDISWSGVHWAMIKLPLPDQKEDRVDLITHELFHVAQPSLEFDFQREENIHLDDKEGRIYLRLEIAALREALLSPRLKRSEEHLRNALIFRKYRHLLFRGADVSENSLEMLEGLASYTGQMMSGRDKWQLRDYLINRLISFEDLPSYVRTFAYETVPVYGFFLYQKDNDWNMKVDADSDLTDLFSEAFGMDMRIILQTYVRQVAEEYSGRVIADEEQRAFG